MPQAMQDSMADCPIFHELDDDPIAISYMYTQPKWKHTSFPWGGFGNTGRALLGPISDWEDHPGLLKTAEGLTDEHRSKARQIRDYYCNKLMLAALKDHKMSQFRQDLWTFLQRDDNQYSTEELGMIKRLPLFYAEDQFLEKIRVDYNNTPRNRAKDNPGGEYLTLTYIGSFEKRTRLTFSKMRNCVSYWFHDEDDRLFNIILEEYNPFRDIWSNIIQEGPIDINCIGPVRENYRSVIDLHYLDSGNWILESR
jgi:hypothetical protein